MTGQRPQTLTVSLDDRARVPFAVIGALMLVTSVMVVGVLESRDTPETDIDQTLAMDRTESAAQSELRGVVVDATHQAAAQPVTTSSELEGDDDEVFENYLELLIYLDAQESLPNAGQSVGDAETTVELEGEVSSDVGTAVDEADSRVDVRELDGDGLLEVSVDRVRITLEEDDRVVTERTLDDLTVVVGTPIFELQETAQEYEAMLNEGFFEGEPTALENLAHKTAVRLYPMAYFKSFINRMDPGDGESPNEWTFDEILNNDHTEVLTNDAIFGVQEEVFGEDAVDPHADRVMRPAWACLVADMLETMTDSDDDEAEDDDPYRATVSVDEFDSRLSNATVFVDGEERGTTGYGSDVSFELEENRTYSVVVLSDDYQRYENDVEFSEADAHHDVSLAPELDRTVGVYDTRGQPTEGADVNIWTDDGLVYATTGSDGTVDLEELGVDDRSEVTVEIFAENYDDSSETVEIDRSYNAILTSEDETSLDDLEDTAGLLSYFEDDPNIKDTVCDDFRDYIFGDEDGDLPDAPSLTEIIGGLFGDQSPLTQNETVEPNDLADIAYHEMIGVDEISSVLDDLPDDMNPGDIDEPIAYDQGYDPEIEEGGFIDDIYDVDVSRSTETESDSLTRNTSHSFENYTYNRSEYDSGGVTDLDVSLSQNWDRTAGEYADRSLHSLEVTVDIEVQERSVFENTTENGTDMRTIVRDHQTFEVSLDIDIDGDLTDGFTVPENEIADDFEAGDGYPARGDITGLSDPDNYETVVIDSLETLLNVNSLDPDDPDDSLEDQIEANLNSSISVSSIRSSDNGGFLGPEFDLEQSVRVGVNGATSTSYDFDDLEADSALTADELLEWLKDDLYEVNAYVKKETDAVEQPRIEFLQTPSPFRLLENEIEDVEDELVETDSYDNVPDLIRMEVRKTYFEKLTDQINEMAEFHEEMVDDVDDAMSAGDGALDDSLDFIQEIFAGDVEASSGELDGSELMGDIEFEISGSPTYMDIEPVDDDEVPSVRPPDSTVMEHHEDGKHAALGVQYQQRLPTPGLPLIPWPPMLYVLQVNSYNVDLEGEYSRFEVSSTAGDPADGEGTTYVRDRMDVEVDLGGDTREKIGEVEPITFDTSLEILIVMPGLMPMKSGAPPNTGDPEFGSDIGLSELLEELANALDSDETAALEDEVPTEWYGGTGPHYPES